MQKKSDFYGVDPVTKDMSVVEFYIHLLKQKNGDRRKIRDFLKTLGNDNCEGPLGFLHTCFMDCAYNSFDFAQKRNYCEKLSDLSQRWKKNKIVNMQHTANDFIENQDLRDRYMFSVVTLRYFEQWGARFWVKYAKEMRGTVLFVNPETLNVKILSYKLDRGAEVKTNLLKTVEDTQDIKAGKVKILDLEQQDTCERLCKNMPIKAYATSKGDGSLLVINVYSGEARGIMEAVARVFGNEFIQIWLDQSLKVTDGKKIAIPATQGTVMEGGFMASYLVTSMLVGAGIVDRPTLEARHAKMDHVDAWREYGEKFVEKIFSMKFFDNLSEVHTLCFEAICKDRTGAFVGDTTHNELAVNYPRDRLLFLGISIAERRFYVPHMIYTQMINANQNDGTMPFEEPLWWRIEHANELEAIMKSLSSLIRRKCTKDEFFAQHQPDNNDFDIKTAILDYEGMIIMKEATYPSDDADWTIVEQSLGLVRTIYSKNKLEEYYMAHNFHAKKIPYLVKLATDMSSTVRSECDDESAKGVAKTKDDSSFHLAIKVGDLFAPGVLSERLRVVGAETMELLQFDDPQCPILLEIRKSHEMAVAEATKASEEGGKKVKIPKDPLNGFEKRPFDIQCRIALNVVGFDFGALLVPIYKREFPMMDDSNPDIGMTLRSLTMELQPWQEGYEDRISALEPTNKSVQGLISACAGLKLI